MRVDLQRLPPVVGDPDLVTLRAAGEWQRLRREIPRFDPFTLSD
jgi:hypothetical protein